MSSRTSCAKSETLAPSNAASAYQVRRREGQQEPTGHAQQSRRFSCRAPPESTDVGTASGDRQLPAHLRRLLDSIDEAMQVHRSVERGQAALSGTDRLGE